MKRSELRESNRDELEIRLRDNLEALQNLRFQKALQQVENPLEIRRIRKEIAQIKTVLNEYELQIRPEQGEGK